MHHNIDLLATHTAE